MRSPASLAQVFNEAIKAAWEYKTKGTDFIHEVLELLDDVRVSCVLAPTLGCVGSHIARLNAAVDRAAPQDTLGAGAGAGASE